MNVRTWPAPVRHLLLLLASTLLGWAGTELIPFLEDQPRYGVIAAAIVAAVLAYATPLVNAYGAGKTVQSTTPAP